MRYTANPQFTSPQRHTYTNIPARLLVTHTHNPERPYDFILYPEIPGVEAPTPLALAAPYPLVKRNPHRIDDPAKLPTEVVQVLNNPNTRFQGITPGATEHALRYGTRVVRDLKRPIELSTISGLLVDNVNGGEAEYTDAVALDIPCTASVITYDAIPNNDKGGFIGISTDAPTLPGWCAWEMVNPETLHVSIFAGDPDSPDAGELIYTCNMPQVSPLSKRATDAQKDFVGLLTFDLNITRLSRAGLTVAGRRDGKLVRDGQVRYIPIMLTVDYGQE